MLAFKAHPTPLFFTCLASWLTEIDILKIVSTPLLHLAFESLFSDELFDAVVDFIVAMFRETRDVYDNTSSIKYLYDELYAVGQKLGALDNSDTDVFRGITRIYVEAGEAWVVLIAHEPEKYEFIVRAVAQCTEYNEDLEVTKITFNFWYELTQLITVDKHRRA
jgi:transportin-3